MLYAYRMLGDVFTVAGFDVNSLDYFDEEVRLTARFGLRAAGWCVVLSDLMNATNNSNLPIHR